MVRSPGRADATLRIAIGAAVASVAVLAVLLLTAPHPVEVDPMVERARRSRLDEASYGRVVGLEWVGLGAVLGLSLGLGAAAVALALRLPAARPGFAPDWPWVALALTLGLLGPALLWPAQDSPRGPYTPFENAMTGWFCVLVAWVLAGAGLRPRGSRGRGAGLALALYVLLGLALDYWGDLRADALGHGEVAHPVTLLTAAVEGLFLPLGLADRLGLFGYVTFAN